jgi:outer membrane assembly lipoprotein YfiO
MRPFFRYALLFLILLTVWGCGQKGARLQKSVVPPDKTLFETGSEYLKKSQYIKARLAFQTLINTYPDSDMAAESYLAIGDSFYNEGGTENLLQAEDQYKNFIIFFPTNPKAADAQMKIISVNMKMMHAPDRDQQNSYKAEQAIRAMLRQFPDSDYVPIARQLLNEVQETLAESDYGVGQFYAQRGNFAGARSRYKDIVDKYPNFSAMDDTYYQLAQALEKTENSDEAAIYYTKIASGYPFSKYFDAAKERLKSMGKPVPEVDKQLAALNESKLKPSEGFSPLKPFIDFATALGFKGPPDRYKEAQKQVAEKKAEEAAQAGTQAQGEKTADDILIQTTLSKDQSGKTQTQTVLGGSPNGTQTAPQVSGDTNNKKDAGKNSKKKTNSKKTDTKQKP